MTHHTYGLEDMPIEEVKAELSKYRSSQKINISEKSDEELRSLLKILKITFNDMPEEDEEEI